MRPAGAVVAGSVCSGWSWAAAGAADTSSRASGVSQAVARIERRVDHGAAAAPTDRCTERESGEAVVRAVAALRLAPLLGVP